MADMGLDCTIKLNPTLLGAADVNGILRERLGYADVHVPPSAFEKDPGWEQAVAIIERLQRRANELGRSFAIKLTNTLLVENRSDFLPRSEKFAYLSGRPLHVLAMHLVQRFRRTFGNSLPISFSAGIDRLNYPDAVRLGLAPVTVWPATSIMPAVGSISRISVRTRVDLPDPERPMTTNTSPGQTSRETSATAATQPVLARSSARESSASGVPTTSSALGPKIFQIPAARITGSPRAPASVGAAAGKTG